MVGSLESRETGEPEVMSRAMPRNTLRVPRVTMKAGSPKRTVMMPFTNPAAAPTIKPPTMAMTGSTSWTSRIAATLLDSA